MSVQRGQLQLHLTIAKRIFLVVKILTEVMQLFYLLFYVIAHG